MSNLSKRPTPQNKSDAPIKQLLRKTKATYANVTQKYPSLQAVGQYINSRIGVNKQKQNKLWIFWLVLTITMFVSNVYEHRGLGTILLALVVLGGYSYYVYAGGQYVLKPKGMGNLLYILHLFIIWQMATGHHTPSTTGSSSSTLHTVTSDPADPQNQYSSQSANTNSQSTSPNTPTEDDGINYSQADSQSAIDTFLKKLPHKGLGYTLSYKMAGSTPEFYVEYTISAKQGDTDYEYQLEQANRAWKDYMESNSLTPINYAVHSK